MTHILNYRTKVNGGKDWYVEASIETRAYDPVPANPAPANPAPTDDVNATWRVKMIPYAAKSVIVIASALALSACAITGGGSEVNSEPVDAVKERSHALDVAYLYEKESNTYYSTVSAKTGKLTEADRFVAVEAVLDKTGPQLCKEGRMVLVKDDGDADASGVEYVAQDGTFVISSRCNKFGQKT